MLERMVISISTPSIVNTPKPLTPLGPSTVGHGQECKGTTQKLAI